MGAGVTIFPHDVVFRTMHLKGLFFSLGTLFPSSLHEGFGDGPRNFEPWSSDVTTPELAPPLLTTTPHQRVYVYGSNATCPEARELFTSQLSQSYAQVAKFLTASTTTQTDETITKIVCPPLKLLQALISIPKPAMSSRIPIVTKSSTSTQAHHLSSTSSVAVTTSS
ncbi:hypothetical protein TNCV_3466171 [Trichonephila clavipes]|nr:hypothetical protein TNCV_3466171 [Trichonephila clavipes]